MLNVFLKQLSLVNQGFLALIIGAILLFGSLGKLGFFQQFLNIFMVVVGLYLLIWGIDKSNIISKIKNMKK